MRNSSDKFGLKSSAAVAIIGVFSFVGSPAGAQSTQIASNTPGVASNSNVADASQVETVTVTARRKSENEQNVPISMSVVTGEALSDNGISSALRLSELVPSLQVLSFNARNTNISVRGLGSNIGLANDGVEGGVGVYVDGVFYPRPAEATFDLPDIATIEELRGPQGTLYGKNTTAGAINITTELPTDALEAQSSVSFGNRGYDEFTGTVSGPLTDDGTLLGRVSGFDSDHDGFIKNTTTGRDTNDYHDYGFRGQLLYQPTSDFTLRLIADYNHQSEQCCISVISGVITTLADGQALPRNFYQRSAQAGYTPLPIDPFARETDADSPYHEIMEQGGVSAQADWRFGGGYDLTSITAYRFWNWDPANDADDIGLPILTLAQQADQEKDFSQEFRISSPAGERVEYSAGLYYFWEDDHGFGNTTYGADAPIWILGASNPVTQAALNGVGEMSQSDPRINSYAAYGQAIWHILSNLDLTGGVRYTYEQKTGTYFQNVYGGPDLSTLPPAEIPTINALRAAFNLVPLSYAVKSSTGMPAGLVTLTYRVDDDLSTYATYSHGAKSGGMNLTFLPPGVPTVVQPEYEDNYEIGVKSAWFDHRLVLNADAFWDNDTNYQATLLQPTLLLQYIANIPGVRSRGFEADLRAQPIDGLSTYVSAAYTDAVYTSYPGAPDPIEDYTVSGTGALVTTGTRSLTGYGLADTPKWALSAGGEYDHGLGEVGFGSVDGYLGADVNYRSSFYSSADDSIYGIVHGYEVTNLRGGVRTEDGRWDLQLWARNAFDTHYYEFIGKVAFNSGALSAFPGDPRTFGATLSFKY
jgi:iron complex outermembrane recepter protein